MKKSSIVLSGLMLLVMADCMALSLGRHRGAALIGRPLDISVQAVLDGQDDVAGLCMDADVFYADNKLDKSRIRLSAEKLASGSQDALIRIRSTVLVDEPVVSVYLRVGCQQKTERRYVVLAELISDATPDKSLPLTAPSLGSAIARPTGALNGGEPLAAPATARQLDQPVRPKKSRSTPKNGSLGSSASPADVQLAPTLVAPAKESAPKKSRKSASSTESRKSSEPKTSRLKLEPLDLSVERDPQLKASSELLSAPATNLQERSAAAALWQALTAQPQDILRDAEKLQSLEKSVRSLQAQSQKTQSAIDDLGVKLQQAQSERYSNWLVYVLLTMVLAALAAIVYLLRQRLLQGDVVGNDAPWWRKKESQPSQRHSWSDSSPVEQAFASAHELKPASKPAKFSVSSIGADIDLSNPRPGSNLDKLNASFDAAAAPVKPKRADFSLSIPHGARPVKAEELFDVQQQADFFISIGQHDQAIDVLRNHIGEGVDTSALVYLDLFNLYHQLNRKDDYAALRGEFDLLFNTRIPEFDFYTAAGPGLEAYQQALTRIEALWPSPKVLEIIEESIFRRPETDAQAFNLEAYRELLLLYSVAKEITSPEGKPTARLAKVDPLSQSGGNLQAQPVGFAATSIQPLSASIESSRRPGITDSNFELTSVFTVPPTSSRLGLDIDLTDVAPADRPEPLKKSADDSYNLIDFDSFDEPMALPDKSKPDASK